MANLADIDKHVTVANVEDIAIQILVKLNAIPVPPIIAESAFAAYRSMVQNVANDLAVLIVPPGLFYENGKATLLNGLLKQNHEDLANECALIIEETRNRYFGWIMGEHAKNYEGFETTTTGHDLNLRVQPTIHRNRLQMWAQFLGYPGPYPFDISDRVLSFKQWIKERADVNLNPKLADVIRSMGIDL